MTESIPVTDKSQIEASIQNCYSTWGEVYYDEYYGEMAPYPPVHVDIQRGELKKAGVRTLLDAGCGPASFLRHLKDDSIEFWGFDLTPEMVTEGQRVLKSLSVEPSRIWQGSIVEASSFRPAHIDLPENFDAVVCGGVLPHIPQDLEARVFDNILNALVPGGLALIEARNQFFSLFTGNRYTYEFIAEKLVRRSELINSAGEAGPAVVDALEDFKAQFRMDLPPLRKGKQDEPGYDEVLSRTHNPLLLKQHLESAGFIDVELLFYHYHCLPPMLSGATRELFLEQSIAMEDPRDWRGHFMASALIASGRRP